MCASSIALRERGRTRGDRGAATHPRLSPAATGSPTRTNGFVRCISTVEEAINDPTCTIVDVRTAPEFRGERFWPSGGLEEGGRAGHVPSAAHLPIEGTYDEQGSFRSAADLGQLFFSIDPSGDRGVISYC